MLNYYYVITKYTEFKIVHRTVRANKFTKFKQTPVTLCAICAKLEEG